MSHSMAIKRINKQKRKTLSALQVQIQASCWQRLGMITMDRRSTKQLPLPFSICLSRTMRICMFSLLRNRQGDSAGRTPAAQVLSQPQLHDGYCTSIDLRKINVIWCPATNTKNPEHFATPTWQPHEHATENPINFDLISTLHAGDHLAHWRTLFKQLIHPTCYEY